jgi:two-component system nitrate/nitrite response regulator NarL
VTDTAMQDSLRFRASAAAAADSRVAIVEDHDLLSQSLAFALTNLGIRVTRVPDPHPAAVLQTLRESEQDLVLLDYDLGEAGLGVDLVRPIRQLDINVVMLTGETDPVKLAECVEAGAIGIISKKEPFERLIDLVGDVVTGRAILSMGARERMLAELRAHRAQEGEKLAPFQRLTVRECEVLQDLLEGKNAERIANESFVSVATVRSHIKSLLAKLGVNSQLAAVALARRSGWASPHQRPDTPS